MNQLQLLQELKPHAYRLYKYLELTVNDQNVSWKKGEDIQRAIRISHKTYYESLNQLLEKGLIEHDGRKNYFKVLEAENT